MSRNAEMIDNLATLLAPVSEESFLEHFLDKKRLHVKGSRPARAAELFSWPTINHLIESDMLPAERLRVVRANVDILPSMFRHKDGARGLRAGALQALLSQGVSMIMNGVGDYVPQIGRLSDAIERRLGHRAWVNAYLSFGRGSALKAHWDEHDVLVVQVHGNKRWRSYGTPVPFPVSNYNAGKDLGTTIVWEGVLEAGDVLYLPRGEVHEAAVEGLNSVHLTIGLQTPCAIDFLGWLAEKAAADVVLRKDVTRLGGEAGLEHRESEIKARLHALIEAASLTDYLRSEDARRKLRPLLNLGVDEALGPSTMLVPSLRRPVPPRAAGANDGALEIGGETFNLSADAQNVLAHLMHADAASFAEILAAFAGSLDEAALRKSVLDLARQGLLGLEPGRDS
jgi:ribosomal protein L16 Arg81 hydroxylase